LDIKAIRFGDVLWETVINYAENCSWGAGQFLAKQMKENRFIDWERVFVATDDSRICGYCTLAKTDCIPDVDYTPYIGYMFVGEEYRGHRLSQQMIKQALEYAKTLGFTKVFIVSGEKGLYEKYGFSKIADKKDFWGRDEQIFCIGFSNTGKKCDANVRCW
jgi:predicted N-acetyltransferase YhbS